MRSTIFHSPTILIITDRTDLDDQLSKQFISSKKYIGDETVVSIDSREKLRQELQGRTSGGVYMTTIQKFTEDLKLLTDRANVICISDEAHRSQIILFFTFVKYLQILKLKFDFPPRIEYTGFRKSSRRNYDAAAIFSHQPPFHQRYSHHQLESIYR